MSIMWSAMGAETRVSVCWDERVQGIGDRGQPAKACRRGLGGYPLSPVPYPLQFLLARELRLPLLHVRVQPFLRVLRVEEERLQLALQGEALLPREDRK